MSYLSEELPEQVYGLKFLFLGLAQTGKSSIIKVIIENMDTHETKMLPTTVKTKKELFDFSGYTFNVYDTGGEISYLEEAFVELRESIFSHVKAFFYIIDVSDMKDVEISKQYFVRALKYVKEYSKDAQMRVLAHKIDLIDKDLREETLKTVSDLFNLEDYPEVQILETSIYEQSLIYAIKSVI
ncbi:MAG: 50S ribosome-binding GTPase [Candidatus Heimdallarchaeota archaeon]|nr:50S ribosome-binding GTPase [Candidatus Heimdallarchaeota archaeon]